MSKGKEIVGMPVASAQGTKSAIIAGLMEAFPLRDVELEEGMPGFGRVRVRVEPHTNPLLPSDIEAWLHENGAVGISWAVEMHYGDAPFLPPIEKPEPSPLLQRQGTTDWWQKPKEKRKTRGSTVHGPLACPWCNSTEVDAEFVDNGVGMQQVTPYLCGECGSSELYPDDFKPDRNPPLTPLEAQYGWHEPPPEGAVLIIEKELREALSKFVGTQNTSLTRKVLEAAATRKLDELKEKGYPIVDGVVLRAEGPVEFTRPGTAESPMFVVEIPAAKRPNASAKETHVEVIPVPSTVSFDTLKGLAKRTNRPIITGKQGEVTLIGDPAMPEDRVELHAKGYQIPPTDGGRALRVESVGVSKDSMLTPGGKK